MLRAFDDVVRSKQSPGLWLWMFPRLLGWERSITSVFFRTLGSCSRLWGIDSAGHLTIVETQIDGGETVKDPFKHLLAYAKLRCQTERWATRELHANWREYMTSGQDLAAELVAPWPLMGRCAYKRAVRQAFARREAAGNPPPMFIALVASTRSEFRLSEEGLKNLLLLEKLAGCPRVALRGMSVSRGPKGLRINCWSPRPIDATNRRWGRFYDLC